MAYELKASSCDPLSTYFLSIKVTHSLCQYNPNWFMNVVRRFKLKQTSVLNVTNVKVIFNWNINTGPFESWKIRLLYSVEAPNFA